MKSRLQRKGDEHPSSEKHFSRHGSPINFDLRHARAGSSRLEVDKPHQDSSAPADVTIIDQGRFAFVEFDVKNETNDGPVINGVHVVQALPSSLAGRAEVFSALDASLQVSLLCFSKLL